MLTANGCKTRRQRLLDALKPTEPLVLADPQNLRYFAGFHVDPLSLAADYGGLLVIEPAGKATLYRDDKLPKSANETHVDETVILPWYDGQSPGKCPRRLVLRPVVEKFGRVHDSVADSMATELWTAIANLRRAKDADEIAALSKCMRACEAGHAWARLNVKPGMTEVEVYAGIVEACTVAAGQMVQVYGDFAVSPGSARRGGPPTTQEIKPGDTLILDFSVVIDGYRSDFTNTLVVGKEPTPNQRRLFDLCVAAMAAGEEKLKAGTLCQTVYDAVRGVFSVEKMDQHFPHHAGHGLGLSHPEPPYIVRQSTEALIAGDVVTLEPGLYVDGIGGIRIEHNYLVTMAGFERLSHHTIALK